MKRRVLFAASLLLAGAALGQQGWRDAKGEPVADSGSRRTKDGFAGSLSVVTDADWARKWNTPSTTVPSFHEARDIAKGERVFALIFFANPLPSAQGVVDLRCDIDIVRPDGSAALHQADLPCWHGPIRGPLSNTYLSQPVVEFSGDPPDPVGDWRVRVVLKDSTRQTALPLETSFHLH